MITALIIAAVIVGFAVAGLVVTAAALGRPQGRHRSDEAARWFRSPSTETPAPRFSAVQVSRPGDPRSGVREVRAGATMTPAPRGAVRAGQATGPGVPSPAPGAALEPAPPARAASADPAPDGPPSTLGPGQHAFDGHRERPPWVIWHRPHGEQLVIGYGPAAEIPRPYAQARITGAHVIVPGPPLVSRRMRAHEAHVDKAVNQS